MIAAVTMVRDEADVIRPVVEHLLEQGIDWILVADNLSSDATPEILERLVEEHPQVHTIEDRDPGYYQARKMNGLAAIAATRGADWIVPFDADEFWYSPLGKLGHVLEQATAADVLYARTWEHVSPTHRKPEPKRFPKVAYRWNDHAVLAQGNHEVEWPGARRFAGALEIREFQYRGVAHLIRKVRNGKAAYDATNLPPSEGAHWRQLGALNDENLEYLYACHVAAGTVFDPPPFDAGVTW